ncbi:YjfB family protein [Lysinibacillus xylanilyticus]|uniref:Putative motility protein n=1 Tax=Lysinibacillus xylanilyticus TaxID=582475 RepID=A0A2M9Q0D5_9BACI|nr:YjfB family protein [Lysinibacillus xylanilyticus]PJO41528.1 putative motility protein [Lysinibacillus xylanilyticus]
MDIAGLSMAMNQTSLMQNVSLAVTKQAMEMQQQNSEQLVEMLDAPHPTAGHTIDVQV